jgi:hypothetical protein
MPEEVKTAPAEGAAESSPAFEIPKAGTEAYHQWRMSSGRTDAVTEKKAEDNGDTPKEEASAASISESSASEAETKSQEKQEKQPKPPRRSNEGDRINEFLDDIRALGLKPNDLKLSREELFQRLSPPPKAVPEKTEQPAAVGPVKREPPKEPEFKGDWDTFDKENRQYIKDLVAYQTESKVEEAISKERVRQIEQAAQAAYREKLNDAKQRYGPEADTTIIRAAREINGDDQIHPTVKQLLGESDILPDLLYQMISKPAEYQSLLVEARERPGMAIRRIALLENLVREELARDAASREQARDESGQFVAAATTPKPAKKTTSAPAPPTEVTGQGSPPGDEQERAFRTKNFRNFREIDNRKALARLRGS